jgi:hypothetical protein
VYVLHALHGVPHVDGKGQEADDGDVSSLDEKQVRIVKSEGVQ